MVSPVSMRNATPQNPVFIDPEPNTLRPSVDVFHSPAEPFFPLMLGFVVGAGKILVRSGPPVFQQGKILFPAAVGGIAGAVAGAQVFLGGAMAGLLPVLPWVLLGAAVGVAVGLLLYYGLQWTFEQRMKPVLSPEECIEKIKQYKIASPEIPIASLVSQLCPELSGIVSLEPALFVSKRQQQRPVVIFDSSQPPPPKKNDGEVLIPKNVLEAAPPVPEEDWSNEDRIPDYKPEPWSSFSEYVRFYQEAVFERWASSVADIYLQGDFNNPVDRLANKVASMALTHGMGLKPLSEPVSRSQTEQIKRQLGMLSYAERVKYYISYVGPSPLPPQPQLLLHLNVPFHRLPDFLRKIQEELISAPIPVEITIDMSHVYPSDDLQYPNSQGYDVVTIPLFLEEVDRDLDLILVALLHTFAETEPFVYGANEFPHLIHALGGAVLVSPQGYNLDEYKDFFRGLLNLSSTGSPAIFSADFALRLKREPAWKRKGMIVETLRNQRHELERLLGRYSQLFPYYYHVKPTEEETAASAP